MLGDILIIAHINKKVNLLRPGSFIESSLSKTRQTAGGFSRLFFILPRFLAPGQDSSKSNRSWFKTTKNPKSLFAVVRLLIITVQLSAFGAFLYTEAILTQSTHRDLTQNKRKFASIRLAYFWLLYQRGQKHSHK